MLHSTSPILPTMTYLWQTKPSYVCTLLVIANIWYKLPVTAPEGGTRKNIALWVNRQWRDKAVEMSFLGFRTVHNSIDILIRHSMAMWCFTTHNGSIATGPWVHINIMMYVIAQGQYILYNLDLKTT